MIIDILSQITEYFNDIYDTLYLSRMNKEIYGNKKKFTLDNTILCNKNKQIPFFTQYRYRYVDYEDVYLSDLSILEKLGIKMVTTPEELLNLGNLMIEELYIKFNQKINFMNIDLSKVKRIRFCNEFNDVVVNLPSHIIKLQFGNNFNHKSIVNFLPKNLKCLIFGNDFNQDLVKPLLYLEYLIFGYSFNSMICFGDNLKYLKFGYKYNEVPRLLPNSLKTLIFGNSFDRSLIIPENLEKLILGDSFTNIINFNNNTKLKYLRFGWKYNRCLTDINSKLPDTIEEIHFCSEYRSKLYNIPNNIKKICLSKDNLKLILSVDQIIKLKDKLYTTYGCKINVKMYDSLIYIS